jgi:hypothetical protein
MTRSKLPHLCPLALLVFFLTASVLPVIARASESVRARVTGAIDESRLVTLSGNIHPLAQPAFDQGPAPAGMTAGRLLLVLQRSAQQEADLRTWLQSTQDPNSSSFRNWLTPEQFGARFGVSDADLAAVQSWLQSHGFTIDRVSKGRTTIEFSGTVGQVQTAFHTSLHRYSVNGATHWANATDPQIPAALAPVVAGLARLNNFSPRAQFIRAPSGVYNSATKRIEPAYTLGNSGNGYTIYLGPADAATVYDLPNKLNPNLSGTAYDGTGVTIGIAGDSNIDVSQNANYRATFGLSPKATTVVVDGADPGENGDAVEAYLDTQVSTGIAPNANIVLYTAADTSFSAGLFLAVDRAIDDNQADILNVSFGSCEAALGTSGNQYLYEIWQQAAAQGISVTVSTGDSGSAGCDDENAETVAQYGLAVNGLASTPYNIAVGGTDFDTLYSNFPSSFTTYVDVTNSLANHRSALKYIPEKPWNDSTFQNDNSTLAANVPWNATQYSYMSNIVAAGGGVSSCSTSSTTTCTAGYAVPNWQSSFAKDQSGRNLPDVSFLAGNGIYGATWGLCTDQDYNSNGTLITDCAGTPATSANFNLTGVGGTSAAAPTMAGILALVKQKVGSRLGQADYVLYDLAKSKYSTVFHDVTTGNNSVNCTPASPGCAQNGGGYYFLTGYNAGTGYDEASGLGSVDASQLLGNWSSAGLTATTSSLTLNGGATALTLTHGAQVTVNVGVNAGGATATGDVALVDNINPATLPNNDALGSVSLLGGSGTGITNSLPGGSYSVSAHYGGSNTLAESDSNAIPVTVSPESSSVTLKVSGYYDPLTGKQLATPYYGSIFLIDAQPYGNSASASSPDGAATGAITFMDGTSTLGTAALTSDGVAELQTQALTGGIHTLSANFAGDSSFKASASAPLAFTVTPALTALQSSSYSANSTCAGESVCIIAGQSVTISAKFVHGYGVLGLNSIGSAPTGTITFFGGASALSTVSVTGTAGTSSAVATGSASFATSQLARGDYQITAVYNGDNNYAASSPSSNYSYVSVQGADATQTIQLSSATIKVNQPEQLTIKLATSGNLPAPTGTITVEAFGISSNCTYVACYTSPAVAIANGTAIVTIPANSLPLGPVSLNVSYSGDQFYGPGGPPMIPIQVNPSGTIVPTVTATVPANFAQTLALNLSVSGPSGDPVPSGSVYLSFGSGTLPSVALTNGSASASLWGFSLVPGPNTITVNYLGDTNYTSGTGTAVVNIFATPNITFAPPQPSVHVDQPLALTVNVSTYPGIPAPTGTITLSSETYTSAAVPLVSGSASITIPANSLNIGSDQLTASYSGDTFYAAGTNSETVVVSASAPSISIGGTALTITHGATTGNTSTITVTPSGGFTGSVALTASILSQPAGASDPPTLSFGATSPVTISGTSAETATLTVTTTPTTTTSNAAREMERASRGGGWIPAGGLALACVFLFIRPAQRRRWQTLLGLLLFALSLTGGVFACGGGSGSSSGGGGSGGGTTTNYGTTTGTYTISVSATSGTVTASTTVQVTVN